MGEALSRALVSKGWFVAMADLRPNAALSEALGSHASFHETNVASYKSQADTFTAVLKSHGRIDALCANAGIGDRSSMYILRHRGQDDIPPEPDLTCTDVNWKGFLYGVQLATHFMRKNPVPGGVVVATASIAGMHPHPSYAEYNGTKAAVVNYVRGSAEVMKLKDNIRLNCVLPGIVPTAIVPKQMIAAVAGEEWVPRCPIVKDVLS
jgi:NAD(P)-dependent dehydrogenase (short-subunit alcohol dehydrogenase family)